MNKNYVSYTLGPSTEGLPARVIGERVSVTAETIGKWRKQKEEKSWKKMEQAHEGWLTCVRDLVPSDYSLALEVVRCQRLVKG